MTHNQIQIYFATNKITFYISKHNEKHCCVEVTSHILCRLPVKPKHKLRNYSFACQRTGGI